ncbi:hypothetical protein ACJX0J_029662, partial [Zea mays]
MRVPFVKEIFESTKGTYGAATELDIYLLRGQRICCFEAHMKLGSSPCYVSGNGTQMKFSPFWKPFFSRKHLHGPGVLRWMVQGWMEQALIIQDCDYRPIFLLLKITGVSLGSMQITFELAMYPNLKGFGPSFLNMFSDIKLGCEKLRSIIIRCTLTFYRICVDKKMLPFSSKEFTGRVGLGFCIENLETTKIPFSTVLYQALFLFTCLDEKNFQHFMMLYSSRDYMLEKKILDIERVYGFIFYVSNIFISMTGRYSADGAGGDASTSLVVVVV